MSIEGVTLMKTLIIYYSLEGNTKFTALELANIIGGDTLELIPEKPIKAKGFSKFLWGGKQVVTNELPKLKPYNFNQESYDQLVIASPIWASHFTPAISTFIADNKLTGNVALIATHEGSNCTKAFNIIGDKLPNCKIIGTLPLLKPLKNPEETMEKLKEFSKQLI